VKTTIFLCLVLGFFVAGCMPPTIFYWGDYSETLYAYKKTPDDKTHDAHKKTLVDIMTNAPKKRERVPPGIYAEYGYMLLKEGKEAEGLEYLQKEETSFPESKVFVDRLIEEYKRGKQ
jgi:hypothetical protein